MFTARRPAGLIAAGLLAAALTVRGADAQEPASTATLRAHLARADSAFDAGDPTTAAREYSAAIALDSSQSRAVYRLAELRRATDLPGALELYRLYVRLEPDDEWGHIALADAERDLARARANAAATIEPFAASSRDSDGITTTGVGLTFTGPAKGSARMFATVGVNRAADPVAARSATHASAGVRLRPDAALDIQLEAGFRRADRSFVDTSGVVAGPGGGPGRGPGMGGPIGRPVTAGVSRFETIPVGRARVVWRVPGNRLRVDARASRVLLDGSPYLVAQGVTREEIGAELDLRAVGPVRVRAFGRTGQVGNEDERNERRVVGGALAIVPRGYDLSLRGQELSYSAPTDLAYFAPRYVRTMELAAYTEREIGRVLLVLDAGAGMQRVAAWTDFPSDWSPALRGWAQLVTPLGSRVSLVLEGEGYDARVGTEQPTFALPEGRWRYGSARVSLRARL